MKLTKRKFTKSTDREPSVYQLIWEQIDELPIEGKRYPLERGRLIKVANERGWYKVKSIMQMRDDDTKHEIHCWWQSTKLMMPHTKGEFRTIRPEHVKHITGEIS